MYFVEDNLHSTNGHQTSVYEFVFHNCFVVFSPECKNNNMNFHLSIQELILYLYQLVQALRYENWHDIFSVQPKRNDRTSKRNVSDVTKEGNSEEVKSTNLTSNRKMPSSFRTGRGGGKSSSCFYFIHQQHCKILNAVVKN